MRVARFIKTPEEKKQYTINYTDWLGADETIVSTAFEIAPDDGVLIVNASSIDSTGKFVSFFISGGTDTANYKVVCRVTTSTGQIKEDYLLFAVDEI